MAEARGSAQKAMGPLYALTTTTRRHRRGTRPRSFLNKFRTRPFRMSLWRQALPAMVSRRTSRLTAKKILAAAYTKVLYFFYDLGHFQLYWLELVKICKFFEKISPKK